MGCSASADVAPKQNIKGHPNCPDGTWKARTPLGTPGNSKLTAYFQAKDDAGKAQMKPMVEAMGIEAIMPNEANITQQRPMFDGMFKGGHMSENDELQEKLAWKEDGTDGMTDCCVKVCKDCDGNDMDLYVCKPKNCPPNAPCLVQNHGGGVSLFTAKIMHEFGLDKRLAIDNNCVIIMPEFRNAPEVKAPKNASDVAEAVKHIHQNAAEFGVDKTKIAMMGQSGGSWITLSACRILSQNPATACMIKAQFLFCPMIYAPWKDMKDSEIEACEKESFFAEFTDAFYRMLATDFEKQMAENDPDLLPGRMSLEDAKKLPPTAILTSECDSVKHDARKFAELMKKTNKFLGLHDMPGTPHGYETHYKQPETIALWKDFTAGFKNWVVDKK